MCPSCQTMMCIIALICTYLRENKASAVSLRVTYSFSCDSSRQLPVQQNLRFLTEYCKLNFKVSKSSVTLFSRPCQPVKILSFITIFIKKCRVRKFQLKFISQVFWQCQSWNPTRVTKIDLSFLRVMTYIHELIWFIRCDSSLLQGTKCLFYIGLLTEGKKKLGENFQPLYLFFCYTDSVWS